MTAILLLTPIIGTWRVSYGDDYSTLTCISNGNYTLAYIGEDFSETITGTWSNAGTNFNSTRQTYTIMYLNEDGEQESDIENVTFSEDFNSFLFDDEDDTWNRQ